MRDSKGIVHGDGFITVGSQREIDTFEKMLAARLVIVMDGLAGFSNSEPSELRVLNRVIRADRINETIELGADARHATKLLHKYGRESANGAKTPRALR